MAKKSKLDKFAKFGKIAIERYENNREIRDATEELYMNDVNALDKFLTEFFGPDTAEKIMTSVEDHDPLNAYRSKKVGDNALVNWEKFKSYCRTRGENDNTDCLKIDHSSSSKYEELSGKVFEKLHDAIESHGITAIEFKMELRTPYTNDAYHVKIDADNLALVTNLRTLRELLLSAVDATIDEFASCIESHIKMLDQDCHLGLISSQYNAVLSQLRDGKPYTDNKPSIRSVCYYGRRELSMTIYDDLAMFIGTMAGMIVDDGNRTFEPNDYINLGMVGTTYALLCIKSVKILTEDKNGVVTEMENERKFPTVVDDTVNLKAISHLVASFRKECE